MNTSLGVAIGFPDLFGAIVNQLGRSLETILIVMAIYLSISLATSTFMNISDKRVQQIENDNTEENHDDATNGRNGILFLSSHILGKD